jgi:D-amino peptidase
MKVYIFADMEGCTGIGCRGHVLKDQPEYPDGCKFMTDDINACIEGCFLGGADEVTVRDGHGSGMNLNPAEIDSRAKLFQGASRGMRYPEFEDTDALILLGYHAMAGTPAALLEHTYSSKSYQNLWLNGVKAGEALLDTAIAGEYGVPVIMVSGDDKTRAEVAGFMPGVPFCQVKTSSGLEKSDSLPFDQAHAMIADMAAGAVKHWREFQPLQFRYPVTLRVERIERAQREGLTGVHYPDPTDCRVYEKSGSNLEELFYELL